MNSFCVYFHITPDTNTVFYVGIGSGRRPYTFSKRSNFWKNVVAKHGLPVVNIVHDGLTWEQACEKEKFYIQQFGRRILKTGTLVNITDGGEGARGCHCSEENKRKLSKLWKGSKRGPLSEKTKCKISIGLKKAFSDPSLREKCKRPRTPETKLKMSLSHKGKTPWNKGKTGIYTNETLSKIAAGSIGNTYRLGKTHTLESRQKMALASMGNHSHLGCRHSEETKLKMSISAKNRIRKPHSEEAKQHMKEAYLRRKEKQIGRAP